MQSNIPNTVTAKEVAKILSIGIKSAKRRLSNIRAALGKKKGNPLLLVEYCRAEGLHIEDVKDLLQ